MIKYPDTMDVWRITTTIEGVITKPVRTQVMTAIPCRVYRPSHADISMQDTAAMISGTEKLACAVSTNLLPGDELLVTRGGKENKQPATRYFAGKPVMYYDRPVHQEISLLLQKRA
jgi:hypothetical protein